MRPNTHWQAAFAALTLALLPAAGAAQEKSAAPNTSAKPEAAATAEPGAKPENTTEKAARHESPHPFVAMAGAWSGGGTLTTSSGERNRLRCRANYNAGHGGRSLRLSIRCASDSYNFDLSSNVVDRNGRISRRLARDRTTACQGPYRAVSAATGFKPWREATAFPPACR